MHRLFIGLRPPHTIRAQLLALMGGVPAARWQSDEQLHLTLRYIGEVSAPMAEDIAMMLARLHAPAPVAQLAGVGRFDKKGRTDSLWAGVVPVAPLAALHNKVNRALALLGLPFEERSFVPHITLARLPRSQGAGPTIDAFIAQHATLASAPFNLAHLILFESQLTSEGAVYEPRARWPLG
ncbi:MAG: RNA 2',3'-cyclic phosphodiesterase [Sphingomonas sp.]|nr:RNA 2',3'-cyclic phosphodiesterase [Sphingomonas sp.]